jgi:hypothetical protein
MSDITRHIHVPAGLSDQPALHTPAPSFRVISGATIHNTGADAAPHEASSGHYQVTHEGAAGGSVLATRQRVMGADTVELIPGTPGSRTNISAALKAGLIEEFAPGQYREAAARSAQEAAEEAQPEPQQDPGAGVFDAEDDQLWAEDIAPLPQPAYDAAVASGIAAIAHGQGSFEQTAKALSSNAGIEPALAQEYVEQGAAMYERAVARGLEPLGLTGARLQQFYDATREDPKALQDALQRLLHMRDVSGFRDMAIAWQTRNPGPEVDQLKAAGFETFTDRETGDLFVRRGQDGWVPAKALLKG